MQRELTIHCSAMLAFAAILIGNAAGAQEVCGIDSIFYDGVEGKVLTLVRHPGAKLSPGVAQSIVGPSTFDVTIVSPSDGAMIGDPTVPVSGTFSGPSDTGITINNVVAHIEGDSFVVPAVQLLSNGTTSLNATATKLTGETASAKVSVEQGGARSPISFLVERTAGFAPFRVNFHYTIGALPSGGGITYVGIDYDGDGADDVANPARGSIPTYVATTPGIVRARLTVKDDKNNVYTAYRYYVVHDLSARGGMLCDVYGYMRSQLNAQPPNIAAALNAIHPNARDEVQPIWEEASSGLAAYVENMGNIANATIAPDFATFLLLRRNADSSLSGFHMTFSRDRAGVWRISNL